MTYFTVTEDFKNCKYLFSFSKMEDLFYIHSEIKDILKFKNKYDTLNLEVLDKSLDELSYTENNVKEIDLSSLSDELDEDSNDFQLKIIIIKNNFSIYSLKSFYEFIKELRFSHIINNFNSIVDKHPESLNIIELDRHVKSTICTNPENKLDRKKYISIMGDSVNAFGFPSHSLIPNDFDFSGAQLNSDKKLQDIYTFFESMKGLLALLFLSDFVELDNNKIILKINNTYTFRAEFDFSQPIFNSPKVINELYKVYRWVYDSQNGEQAQDKLELARIQLAKNLSVSKGFLDIKTDNIMSNLNSMYKIYLKENVDKYIEATNRVAEIISEMTYKQNEITSSFTNSLKTNSTLLIGFFISLVVYNNLSAGELSIFNNSNFILVVLFTGISAVSLALSFYQVNRNIDRATNYFNKQKEIYLHLFSPDDIKKLFSEEYLNSMNKSVKIERNLYSWVWIIELVAIFFTSLIATYFPDFIFKLISSISMCI